MPIAASPIALSDADWILPVAVLIFAVPIGAFLSLYGVITSFLFHTWREALPVSVLIFLAFAVSICNLLVLVDSAYSGDRYLVVPAVSWIGALVAGGILTYRAVCIGNDAKLARQIRLHEEISRLGEDR